MGSRLPLDAITSLVESSQAKDEGKIIRDLGFCQYIYLVLKRCVIAS